VKKHIAVAALATVFCISAAPAQVDVSSISARVGTIRTLWRDNPVYSEHLWSLYPELEIGGRFFKPYLSWGASWGYWSDGINEVLPVMDMVTYSQAGYILSLRIGFHPQLADEHWPIPVIVFGGLSHHLIKTTYIGGWDIGARRDQGSSDHYADAPLGLGVTVPHDRVTTAHLGLGVTVPLVEMLSLEAEAQQFVPFGSSEGDKAQKDRRAFKVGLQAQF
jgi:hypothetical protein